MQFLLNNDLYWTIKLVVWAVLLFFCFRKSLIRPYPVLSAFIAWDITWSLGLHYAAASLPRGSLVYTYLYYTRYVLTTIWGHVILLQIYFVFGRFSRHRDWHLFMVPLIMMGLAAGDLSRIRFAGWLAVVANAVTVYFGMAAMWRMRGHREINLGWNLRLVLLAFTIPAAFAAIIFMTSSVGFPLQRSTRLIWGRAIALGFWLIMTVGLSDYSPPHLVEPGDEALEIASRERSVDGRPAAEQDEVKA